MTDDASPDTAFGNPTILQRLTWLPIKSLMRLTFQILGGIRVEGLENIPATGGVLLCPNHVCEADPCAVAVVLNRRAHFMANRKIFANPIADRLLHFCLAFPIDRNRPDRDAIRHAEQLLKSGKTVVVFPEGGGNHQQTLQPLNGGALLIALRTRVPVVPVAIFNTYPMWPYGNHIRRTGIPVLVRFGAPIDLSDLYGGKGAVEKATDRLAQKLSTMLDQPVPTKP